MERFWTKNYPEGVPAEIDPSRYASVVELLEEAFESHRDKDAYVLMGRALAYGELDTQSRAFAAYLQTLGLARGDRVAIMMPNVLQYPVALGGVLRAGLIAVNVNPLYTARELKHQLNDSGAKAIVILENFASVLESVIAETGIENVVVTSVGAMLGFPKGRIVDFVLRTVRKQVPAFDLPGHVRFAAALKTGAAASFTKPQIGPDDVAVLQYTGGTTGVSKGATLLHRTIIANLLASEAWMQPALRKNPPDGQLTYICALPLYHVFAFITCSLLGMRTGGRNILIVNPRDLDATIKEMGKYKFHVMPGVNTLFNALNNREDFRALDFSSFSVANGGGMAVQRKVAERWLEITGAPICEGYGLSETSSGVTCNPTDIDAFTGTIGLPMPNVEIKILDDERNEVALGERGEIAIRGPQVMRDYWQRPEETREAFTDDGFFLSGDIGIMDERGYVTIVDRKKDMILVSGFNVYPNEVEGVAVGHPGVVEAACVGVPDADSSEAIMLFVIPRDGSVTADSIREHCARELTGYKKPKYVEFRDDLPRTNVGKILRRELRDEGARIIGG